MNTSGINPCGHRILILPRQIAKKTASGIIMATDNLREREQMANTTGVVVAMGPTCYIEDGFEPWCKVGDKVAFAKFAGLVYTGRDGADYRMVNDGDVTAVLDDDVDLVDPHLTKGI